MESISLSDTASPQKSGGELKKPKKWPLVLFIILTLVFFLGAATLSYFYWKKDESAKKSNQEKQAQIDQLNSDKSDLEKQLTEVKKENEDLKSTNQQSSEQAANKIAIIKAYTEILTYFAQVVETHSGFTGWTTAEYQHARDIAKKTQNSNFLATVDWAWNQTSVDPITRVIRFLKEISTGINENL